MEGVLKTMTSQRGFTLLEILIAVSLLAIVILAVAPMFLLAAERSAAGADMGLVGALAVENMESLRAAPMGSLVAGGSLVSDTSVGATPYFDASEPGYIVRWQVIDNATPVGGKRLTLRALALRQVSGLPKEVTLSSLRVR